MKRAARILAVGALVVGVFGGQSGVMPAKMKLAVCFRREIETNQKTVPPSILVYP